MTQRGDVFAPASERERASFDSQHVNNIGDKELQAVYCAGHTPYQLQGDRAPLLQALHGKLRDCLQAGKLRA
ncbi:MAG TPA: hypothetical protein VIG47_13090 [Gemmatimonadaceae bacterium]